MHRNIPIMLTVHFLHGFTFYLPVFALLLQNTLNSILLVTFIMAFLALGNVILEVPSGAFSDRYGRRNTIIIAGISFIIAIIFLLFAQNFAMLAMYALFSSIGRSLWSGTDSSLIHESKPNNFKKVIGWYQALWPLGASIGAIIGGYLAVINLSLTISYTLIPFGIALFMTAFLVEPKKERTASTLAHHMRETTRFVLKNRTLTYLFIAALLVYATSEVAHQLNPLFYTEKNIPLLFFGILSVFIHAFSFLGHIISHSVSVYFGDKKTLIAATSFLGLTIIAAVFSDKLLAGIFIVTGSLFWGIKEPILLHYYHKHASDHNRATVVSLGNLANELGFAIAAPVFGLIADILTVTQTFAIIGVLHIPVLFIILAARLKK